MSVLLTVHGYAVHANLQHQLSGEATCTWVLANFEANFAWESGGLDLPSKSRPDGGLCSGTAAEIGLFTLDAQHAPVELEQELGRQRSTAGVEQRGVTC